MDHWACVIVTTGCSVFWSKNDNIDKMIHVVEMEANSWSREEHCKEYVKGALRSFGEEMQSQKNI